MKPLEEAVEENRIALIERFTRVTNRTLTSRNPIQTIDAYLSDCNLLLGRYEAENVTLRASTDTIREKAIAVMAETGTVSVYDLYSRGVLREGELKGAGKSLGAIARKQGWVAEEGKTSYRRSNGERSDYTVYKIPS